MSSTVSPPRPAFARCFLALLVGKGALAITGLRCIVGVIDRGTPTGTPNKSSSHGELEGLARQIATAAAFFPGRARCLEQSLVLYAMLRRAGIPAQLRVGVRPHPFEAHAWVEHDGQPILEDPEKMARFIPLPDRGA